MGVMAKDKPKPKDERPPAPKRVRSGYNLNVWIDQDLGEAFDAAIADIVPRTSKTAMLEMLLAEYLESKGLWPKKGGA